MGQNRVRTRKEMIMRNLFWALLLVLPVLAADVAVSLAGPGQSGGPARPMDGST